MRQPFFGIAVALALLLAPRSPAGAQASGPGASGATVPQSRADSVLDARTRELSAQLRCPVCQGLSLQDSPSELSQQMKDVVRAQLAEGRTNEEVKAFFVARYGEWILMSPPAHGFNLLVYMLPLAGLAAGAALLVFLVRRWTQSAATLPDD